VPLTTLGDGRTLQWSERGDPQGLPVFFCHGTPDTRRASWSGHEAAARAGVRLVAANRPGYGDSTPAPPSYRQPSDDVVALADSLGIARFALLGMSVGGTFALATAARRPDRVTALATVGCPGPAALMDPPYPRDDLDDEGRAFFDALADGSPDANVERVRPGFLDYRSGVDPDDPDDQALARRWVEPLPTEDRTLLEKGPAAERAAAAREAIGTPEGYLADAALVFAPWPFDLADVRCPVTLWYGDRDRQAPPRNGVWLAEHLSSAELRVLAGLGHLESLLRSWPEVLAALVGRPG
jgi:pimeloyl-ACP methyl ester carboxylesterase